MNVFEIYDSNDMVFSLNPYYISPCDKNEISREDSLFVLTEHFDDFFRLSLLNSKEYLTLSFDEDYNDYMITDDKSERPILVKIENNVVRFFSENLMEMAFNENYNFTVKLEEHKSVFFIRKLSEDELCYMDFYSYVGCNFELIVKFMEKENNFMIQQSLLYNIISCLDNFDSMRKLCHYLIDNRKKYEINLDYYINGNSCIFQSLICDKVGDITTKLINCGADLSFVTKNGHNITMHAILHNSIFLDYFLSVEQNFEQISMFGTSIIYSLVCLDKNKITEKIVDV